MIDHAHNIVLTYDNLEFSKDRRNEQIDEIRRFKFITSAFMFEPHDQSAVFLFRFMWNSQKYSLSLKMIVSFVINDAIDEKITTLNSLYISIG